MTDLPLSKLTKDGATYEIKDATARSGLANKQDALVSGTNIKTINNESILGSGNISISGDSLPSQTGNSGKFLTTNGSTASWATVSSGTTYTAGDGIIIENNEISVDGVESSEVTLATVAITGAFSDLSGTSGLQTTSNLVTSVSSQSTDSQYPSAKLFYDTVGNIESLLSQV